MFPNFLEYWHIEGGQEVTAKWKSAKDKEEPKQNSQGLE